MSIKKVQSGYQIRVRVIDTAAPAEAWLTKKGKPRKNPPLRRHTETVPNLRDAKSIEHQMIKQREQQIALMQGKIINKSASPLGRTITQAIDEYRSSAAWIGLSDSAKKGYGAILREYIAFSQQHHKVYLHQQDRSFGKAWEAYVASNWSGSGIEKYLAIPRMIWLIEAKERRVSIDAVPIDPVPRTKRDQSLVRAFTPEELEAIYSVTDPFETEICKFLENSGLRTGEFANLHWVRMFEDQMEINRIENFRTKSRKARNVPYNRRLRESIEYFRSVRIDQYVVPRSFYTNRDVFIDLMNSIRARIVEKYPDLADRFTEEDPATGRYKLSMHTFRKTYATNLYRKGVAIQHIQKLLGHADIKTTMVYLADILDTELHDAVKLLD